VAIAITDLRDRVADQPRAFGVQPETPRPCGVADGVTTLFYLPIGKTAYVAGSAQLYYLLPTAAPGTQPSPVVNAGNSAYTVSTQGQIAFTIPPGQTSAPASPIPNGAVISATYQATAFSDTFLTGVLARNLAKYGADDMVLCGSQIEIIDALLMDTEKMSMIRESEYQQNPAYVVKAYVDLKDHLRKQIEEEPRPGKAVPFMMMAGVTLRNYQPRN
jgi:hypothetical protein